ncbi:hypothetical protein C2G38_2028374 [Gigaspora rosea]|uniref:Uncharacterized protein n=1 Tax=Gigaspora rosea TaxID=44941 RepID=A0A397W1R5_9GLOM|nr:hypothetical protein C2G38_2028374 [Gigaspora rosea]
MHEVKNELKRKQEEQDSDLSPRVLDGIYNAIAKYLFPQHVYPTQSVLKETLQSYMELLGKIKNHRGSMLQQVRTAIWNVFGSERLPALQKNPSAATIVKWKESREVSDCHRLLFELKTADTFWVTTIARASFTEVAAPVLTDEHCAFTLAVCDIILKPRSKGVVCFDKRMKCHIAKYLADYNNGGPSYNSSESIINDETTAPSCEKETQQASDLETVSVSQGSGSILLSQDDQDALFSTGLDPDNYNYYDDNY